MQHHWQQFHTYSCGEHSVLLDNVDVGDADEGDLPCPGGPDRANCTTDVHARPRLCMFASVARVVSDG